MNKQLQKQNLDELFSERKIFLMKQTLLNILSAKGVIYTYYKNKKLTKGNYAQRKSKYNS
jgi:cell division protein FtsL